MYLHCYTTLLLVLYSGLSSAHEVMKASLVAMFWLHVHHGQARDAALTAYQRRIKQIERLVNKPKPPTKTKRYKCIEIDDDDEEFDTNNRPSPSHGIPPRNSVIQSSLHDDHDDTDLVAQRHTTQIPQLRRQNSMKKLRKRPALRITPRRLPSAEWNRPVGNSVPPSAAEHKHGGISSGGSSDDSSLRVRIRPRPQAAQQPFAMEQNRQSEEKPPLILSPKHCDQMKRLASMYGLKDVQTWVSKNCGFAKMYIPTATCEEINVLVASCYRR